MKRIQKAESANINKYKINTDNTESNGYLNGYFQAPRGGV